MGIPVEIDISLTGAGDSAWIPLNRFGDGTMRLDAIVDGTVSDYSIVGTQVNVLRAGKLPVAADDELAVPNFTNVAATVSSVQTMLYRAIKIHIETGTGTVRLLAQSEGEP